MLDTSARNIFSDELGLFRDNVRKVFERHMEPHLEKHEAEGIVNLDIWRFVGEAGLLCPTVPEEYGGLGLDFRFNAVVTEELTYMGSSAGFPVQSDIAVGYLEAYGSEEQKLKYLPKLVSGELVIAIAMTEPGTGSDLQEVKTTARSDGNDYLINGSKTYITNGQNADLIIVVANTEPGAGAKGLSLILVESHCDGFARGRNLDKVGLHSADTSELFFEDVRVPKSNLLGPENGGFACLMQKLPQERLCIAIICQAAAQRAFDEAVRFVKDRNAFGQRVFDFQNTRFQLADLKAKLQVGWAHLDWAIARHVQGELTTSEASACKLWHSEMQGAVCDAALQLHGGAGYMNEYLIARLWRDSRVGRIHGGTSEIMKELIGRSI